MNTNTGTHSKSFTPEQIAQLESTCPSWCRDRGEHQWESESNWGDAWSHQREFGDSLWLGICLNNTGQIVAIDMPPMDLNATWAPDEADAAANDLDTVAADFQRAAAFVRELTS